jgi:hypothetical protein
MIVVGMKYLLWTLAICSVLPGAMLNDVRAVYLYPMTGGFDQLLAEQFVAEHMFKVVPDPKLADAVFTEQLGETFLYKLDHINTPPAAAKSSGSAGNMGNEEQVPRTTSFARAKGTLFLVDIKSKEVIWSTYQKPKNTSSVELHKTAVKVATALRILMAGPVTH